VLITVLTPATAALQRRLLFDTEFEFIIPESLRDAPNRKKRKFALFSFCSGVALFGASLDFCSQ